MLATPEAWDCLSEDEKDLVVSLLPNSIRTLIGMKDNVYDGIKTLGTLPQEFLLHDNDWQEGVRMYQQEVGEGQYEEKWQEQAVLASKERDEGKFDNFQEREREKLWGQKQKVEPRAKAKASEAAKARMASEAARVKMDRLVRCGIFKAGDVWRYSRKFERGKSILVEKEAKVTEVAKDATLNFIFPPGQRVSLVDNFSDNDRAEANISVKNITGPQMLARKMIQTDGRVKNPPLHGNAWQETRCVRNNQDLGSLFEMRQAWFEEL